MPRDQRKAAGGLKAVGLLLSASLASGAALGQESALSWQVTPRLEYSDVTVDGKDGKWRSSSLAIDRQLGDGQSLFAVVQRQERNDASDLGFQVGGYARAGDWNAMALVESAPGASFLPRWAYEVQIDRDAGPNRRAGLGYRHLRFGDNHITLWSPYVTFYRGNDELGVSYRFGRNADLDHDIRVLQLRALAVRGKNQFAAYLAEGDYLFDALGLPSASGSGWSANFAFARTINPNATIRLEVGQGAESDTFRQRSFAVSVRFTP